jgi:hypothetical protein
MSGAKGYTAAIDGVIDGVRSGVRREQCQVLVFSE